MKAIKLTQGYVAYVDAEDFERVNAFKWHASVESRGTKVYACRWKTTNKVRRKIRMHRFVMGIGTGFEDERVVNHINDDSLDNTKGNLEIVTQDENMARVERWKRKGQKLADIGF